MLIKCHSECCVPSGFEAASGSAECYCWPNSRASSHCKHDMGAILWLNVEALERVLTPALVDL